MLLASPKNKTNIQPVRVFDPNALLDSTFKLVPPPGSARYDTKAPSLFPSWASGMFSCCVVKLLHSTRLSQPTEENRTHPHQAPHHSIL